MVDLLSDGTFWGLVGIAGAIVFFGLTNWSASKKERTAYEATQKNLNEIGDFMKKMTLSGIDEKIATLNYYALIAKGWKTNPTVRMDRITSDIRAILRVNKLMEDEQKERLNSAIRHLIEEMKKKNFDVGRIEDLTRLM